MLATAVQGIERRVEVPQAGFVVQTSDDYDTMFRQAPVLDPQAAGFHRGNAILWQATIGRSFAAANSAASPELMAIVQDENTRAAATSKTPVEFMSDLISRLDDLPHPRSQPDRFAVAFLQSTLRDSIRLTEISLDANSRIQKLSAGEIAADACREASTVFRSNARELEQMIYRPAALQREVSVREAMCTVLRDLANRADAIAGGIAAASPPPTRISADLRAVLLDKITRAPVTSNGAPPVEWAILVFDEVRRTNSGLNETQLFEVASILGNATSTNAKYYMLFKNGIPDEGRIVENPGFDVRDTSGNVPD